MERKQIQLVAETVVELAKSDVLSICQKHYDYKSSTIAIYMPLYSSDHSLVKPTVVACYVGPMCR